MCSARAVQAAGRAGRMSAWRAHAFAPGGELRLDAARVPVLRAPHQLLVKVHQASLNPLDLLMLGMSYSTRISVARPGIFTRWTSAMVSLSTFWCSPKFCPVQRWSSGALYKNLSQLQREERVSTGGHKLTGAMLDTNLSLDLTLTEIEGTWSRVQQHRDIICSSDYYWVVPIPHLPTSRTHYPGWNGWDCDAVW